jgi:hypothetical protein
MATPQKAGLPDRIKRHRLNNGFSIDARPEMKIKRLKKNFLSLFIFLNWTQPLKIVVLVVG